MQTPELTKKVAPPKIMPSLVEGFNAVARRIYLVLFPVGIDLLLWFGPLVRVKNLVLPALLRASDLSAGAYEGEARAVIENSKQIWEALLDEFNLLTALRTYPIGVPSLMAGQGLGANPFGSPIILEMTSFQSALAVLFFLGAIGLGLGCLYFALVARSASEKLSSLDLSGYFRLAGQTIVTSIFLVLLLAILGLPTICFISSIMFFLPASGTLPMMIFGFMLVWSFLPLAFLPHGIFLGELKISGSLKTSIRLVRSNMSSVGIFFMLIILIGYGMDVLWATPGTDNWMLLVGIFGHGFVASGLLAASFIFYRDGLVWLSEKVRGNEARARQADV